MSKKPQGHTSTDLSPTSSSFSHRRSDLPKAHPSRPALTSHDRRPHKQRLLHSIARPLHSGIEGPFANDWLRTAFIEALMEDERLPDVVTTRHDMDLMLCGNQVEVTDDTLGDRLFVFDTLEESIEHLEAKAVRIRAGHTAPTTIWITESGDHTDVIHQTIDYWAGLDLIALIRGHWPHGPNRQPRPNEWPAALETFAVLAPNDLLRLSQPQTKTLARQPAPSGH
ncbi:hypothetical protein AB0J52_03475 [Spirillospora sp. NPDC049652]